MISLSAVSSLNISPIMTWSSNIWINCSVSLDTLEALSTIPIFYFGDFLFISSKVFVWSMFVTSLLKLGNSTYLSVAFQLNEGCFRAGLHVCLCVSLRLAVLAPNPGLASASHSTITAAVAAWLTTA